MDWDIRETALRCAACANEFQEGQEVCSLLLDKGASFERQDYCNTCWPAQDLSAVYSHWRTMTPHREKPLSRRVNGLVVLDFFHRLEGEEERQKLCFRYVLGLMLMRKKLLKFSGVHRGEGGEEVLLTDPGSGVEYRVCDPKLSPAEVTGLTEEVGKLLNVQFEEPREETGASAAAQAPQEGATSSEVGSQDTGGTR